MRGHAWRLRHERFPAKRWETRAADAHAIVPALHLELRNSRFRCQIDQLTDFIDGHQWISLTYFRRSSRGDA